MGGIAHVDNRQVSVGVDFVAPAVALVVSSGEVPNHLHPNVVVTEP